MLDTMDHMAVHRARSALEMITTNGRIADMDLRDARRYGLSRLIMGLSAGRLEGFEKEISEDLQRKHGTLNAFNSARVPLAPFLLMELNRAQLMDTALSSGAGGYLVGTNNIGFIDLLRNRSVAIRMGAQTMPGLIGNVTIPRETAAATAQWLTTESSSITDTGQTFAQVTLTPHNLGAYCKVSRQLAIQSSPSAQAIIGSDLLKVVGLAIDKAVLHGTNANGQPQGIVGASGVGSVSHSGTFQFSELLEFQSDVAAANGEVSSPGYVTTPEIAALLMQRVRFASTATPLWEGNINDGSILGARAMSSNQVTARHLIYGSDWSSVLIGEWGSLAVEVNPYETFAAGIIGVRVMHSVDVGLRHPQAFSVSTDTE